MSGKVIITQLGHIDFVFSINMLIQEIQEHLPILLFLF